MSGLDIRLITVAEGEGFDHLAFQPTVFKLTALYPSWYVAV